MEIARAPSSPFSTIPSPSIGTSTLKSSTVSCASPPFHQSLPFLNLQDRGLGVSFCSAWCFVKDTYLSHTLLRRRRFSVPPNLRHLPSQNHPISISSIQYLVNSVTHLHPLVDF
ncbi:hypothetical protein LXL04_027118 [Taraxacum kok-saghyz]